MSRQLQLSVYGVLVLIIYFLLYSILGEMFFYMSRTFDVASSWILSFLLLLVVYIIVINRGICSFLSGCMNMFDFATIKTGQHITFWVPLLYSVYYLSSIYEKANDAGNINFMFVNIIALTLFVERKMIQVNATSLNFKTNTVQKKIADALILISEGAPYGLAINSVEKDALLTKKDREEIIKILLEDLNALPAIEITNDKHKTKKVLASLVANNVIEEKITSDKIDFEKLDEILDRKIREIYREKSDIIKYPLNDQTRSKSKYWDSAEEEPQYITPEKGDKPKFVSKEFDDLPKEQQAKAILQTLAKYINKTPDQIKKMEEGNK